jgi:hypothetical protein
VAPRFEIRRLAVGEILDEGFKLFRHGFWRFLFFQLLLYLPSIAVFGVAFKMGGDALIEMIESGELPKMSELISAFALFAGAILLIQGIVGPISTVALTRGVADTYLSRPWTVRSLLVQALAIAPQAIAVGFLLILVALAGFIVPLGLTAGGLFLLSGESLLAGNLGAIGLAVLATAISGSVALALGMWILVRYSVALIALAVEGTDTVESFHRSTRLIAGRFWPALGLFLIQIAFNLLAGLLLSMLVPTPSFEGISSEELKALIPQLVRSQILSSVLSQAAGMIVGTYTVICWTLFYFSMRCEKEGFDLSYLADRVARGE